MKNLGRKAVATDVYLFECSGRLSRRTVEMIEGAQKTCSEGRMLL